MTPANVPHDVFMKIVSNLQPLSVLRLGSACSSIRAISIEVADLLAVEQLDGLDGGCSLRKQCHEKNQKLHRILLCAALQPYHVIRGCQQHWPDMTIPFRFAVDTQCPLFLEFQIHVAKAINGTPKVGFVDGESAYVKAQEKRNQWPADPCHGKQGPGIFALGFDPEYGTLRATKTAIRGQSSRSIASALCAPCANSKRMCEYYTGALKWDQLGDCMQAWNAPLHAAFGFAQGKLTFYRRRGNDKWESSGNIFGDLPRVMVPCVFMSSFVGYAKVKFVRISSRLPDPCLICETRSHSEAHSEPCDECGLVNGWRRIVR
mmetsp:Transcript_24346/g.38981  ORF Transcript_24346/g.38981 Transcript_24346/m.38981 type:complete len:318 (+) Transcript_24346:56-1009(+)